MRVFLDFEASSLNDDSYPIEVGWIDEAGGVESHLIRPAPAWTDWDCAAEAVHGITRERLVAEGEPHEQVAHRVLDALGAHEVFVSAPSWDGKWLSVLLRGAGLPRHAMRFKDSDEAHRTAVSQILNDVCQAAEIGVITEKLVAEARERVASGPPRHRALADAEQEREIWLEVRRLAQAEAERYRS